MIEITRHTYDPRNAAHDPKDPETWSKSQIYEATEEEVEAIYREVMRKCPNVMAGLAKR